MVGGGKYRTLSRIMVPNKPVDQEVKTSNLAKIVMKIRKIPMDMFSINPMKFCKKESGDGGDLVRGWGDDMRWWGRRRRVGLSIWIAPDGDTFLRKVEEEGEGEEGAL